MCEISVHMDKYSHLYTLIDVRFYVFMQLLVIHALIYAFIDYLCNVYASPPTPPPFPFMVDLFNIFLYELIMMMDKGDFYSTHLSHNLGAQGAL